MIRKLSCFCPECNKKLLPGSVNCPCGWRKEREKVGPRCRECNGDIFRGGLCRHHYDQRRPKDAYEQRLERESFVLCQVLRDEPPDIEREFLRACALRSLGKVNLSDEKEVKNALEKFKSQRK